MHVRIIFFIVLALQSSYGFAQLESFPDSLILPNTKQIIAWQLEVNNGDSLRYKREIWEFDKQKNLIKYDHFLYHLHEERTYNKQNQLVQLDALYGESFGNGFTMFTYPKQGQLKSHFTGAVYERFGIIDSIFNKQGQVTKVNVYDSLVAYEDFKDDFLTAKPSMQYQSFMYDSLGRLSKKILQTNDSSYTEETYQYDAQKRLHTVTTSHTTPFSTFSNQLNYYYKDTIIIIESKNSALAVQKVEYIFKEKLLIRRNEYNAEDKLTEQIDYEYLFF